MTDQVPDWLARIRAAATAYRNALSADAGTLHSAANALWDLATDPEYGLAALAERVWQAERERDAAYEDAKTAINERNELRQQIEDGRCCDDYERLASCGHPRCCVSETCELCVELGNATSALEDDRDALRQRVAELEMRVFELQTQKIGTR